MILSVAILGAIFWIQQVIDLLRRDIDYFESHTHKLVWFIAFCVGNIVAAIWYVYWKKSVRKTSSRSESE